MRHRGPRRRIIRPVSEDALPMRSRAMVIERDDPAEPGPLVRRYARIAVCWEATLGGWAWILGLVPDAAEEPLSPITGLFPAFEDAPVMLRGRWEDREAAALLA